MDEHPFSVSEVLFLDDRISHNDVTEKDRGTGRDDQCNRSVIVGKFREHGN